MRKVPFLRLLIFFSASIFAVVSFANSDLSSFMTPRDLMSNDSSSNITLHNNSNSTTTVYGLYVRQYSSVAPGESCNDAASIYSANITAGAMVMPVVIGPGKSVIIGSNYLYNMIYQASYYMRTLEPSCTPGCSLPGCTWGNDVPSDACPGNTYNYNWCIYLGALGPVTTPAGYTASVPPSVSDASSGEHGYNYNLIEAGHYDYMGPISCNDQTLTCTVTNQQTQSFP